MKAGHPYDTIVIGAGQATLGSMGIMKARREVRQLASRRACRPRVGGATPQMKDL